MKITKDYILRLVFTFFEGALAYVIIQLQRGVDFNSKEAVRTFVLGLIAAGISALINLGKLKIEDEDLPEDIEYTEGESDDL